MSHKRVNILYNLNFFIFLLPLVRRPNILLKNVKKILVLLLELSHLAKLLCGFQNLIQG